MPLRRYEPFFSSAEQERLRELETNKLLYEGKHHLAFPDDVPDDDQGRGRTYLIVNFLRLLSEIQAELLFASDMTIRSATGDDKQQAGLDLIATESDLQSVALEAELCRSWAGTAWVRCSYDELQEGSGAFLPTVEVLDPLTVFPVWSKRNSRRLAAVEIKLIVEGDNGRLYGRIQRHTPGAIEEELYELSERHQVLKSVPLGTLFGEDAPSERLETGIPAILVVPVTGVKSAGQPLGESDYTISLKGLQAEINSRFSAISRILDRHVDPKILLSQELFDMLMDPNGKVSAKDMQVIGVPPGDQVKPEYLVWDARLEAAFEQLKQVTDALLTLSRTSPVAAGINREQGAPDSGKALKLRLLQSLSKRMIQARYWRDALLQILWLAQLIHTHPKWGGERYEPADPTIEFGQAIPVRDDLEDAQVVNIQRTAGVVSLQTAVEQIHPDWSAERVREELDRIAEEQGDGVVDEPDPEVARFRERMDQMMLEGGKPDGGMGDA